MTKEIDQESVMQNKRYQVSVPTVDDWREMVKCQAACTVYPDARGYVMAMARGDLKLGFDISHDPNPLSTICGRICGAPCEDACRRGFISEDQKPIAIRPIKRVLTERHGPEALEIVPERELSPESITSELDILNEDVLFSPAIGKEDKVIDLPGTGSPIPFSTPRDS